LISGILECFLNGDRGRDFISFSHDEDGNQLLSLFLFNFHELLLMFQESEFLISKSLFGRGKALGVRGKTTSDLRLTLSRDP
jgi:hypothetical protein